MRSSTLVLPVLGDTTTDHEEPVVSEGVSAREAPTVREQRAVRKAARAASTATGTSSVMVAEQAMAAAAKPPVQGLMMHVLGDCGYCLEPLEK